MTETEFNQQVDALFNQIGAALDASDADCDWDLQEGILTIDTEGGQVIINRHLPNQEIWLASKLGAAHFRDQEGQWQDTRSPTLFVNAVRDCLQKLMGVNIHISN